MNPPVQKPHLRILICLILAAITYAAFAGVAHCSFITLDDRVYVVANPPVQHGFSSSSVKWALQTFHGGYWIPVTWFSHMLDCQLYGLNPTGHHITNLIFHIANTVLLFLLLERLTARLWPSAFVALLFGIHPMHVESVAWVAERKDVLSSFFFLLTLLAYTYYGQLKTLSPDEAEQTHPPSSILHPRFRWLAYILALVFFALGLMSKPMLVTLPFVLLLLDFWPLQRFFASGAAIAHAASKGNEDGSTLAPRRSLANAGQRLFLEKLPFFLLAAAFSYITFLTQRSAGAVKPAVEYSIAGRFFHVPVAYAWYLEKLFWPVNLSVFYPMHGSASSVLEFVSASILLLAITAFALAHARRFPYLLFGWLWFLGTLVPVIGVVQSGEQAYADRFAYLPYIGLFVVIAWGIPDLAGLSRASCEPVSESLVPRLQRDRPHPGLLPHRSSLRYAPTWEKGNNRPVVGNDEPLDMSTTYRRELRIVGTALFVGAGVLAVACFVRTVQEVRYWKDGIILCQRAIALDAKNGYAWMALGAEYSNHGNFDKAVECMTRATTLDPELDMAWHDLGKLLAQKGNYHDAENAYQAALERTWNNGNKFEIYEDLGDSLASGGAYERAITAYQSALEFNPNQPDIQAKLGQCFLQTRQPDQAGAAFAAAIELQPNNADALAGLGMILQSAGQGSDAVAQYRKALEANPDSLIALNNLAWLLATDSDPALRNGSEAISLAEHACQLTHYKRAFMIGTLAAAYAEAGRFDEAVATAQKAHDVALAGGEKDLASRNAQLLQLYKARRPFRDETPAAQTKK